MLGGKPRKPLTFSTFDLGQLDGVALHITDAANVGEGRTMFLAVAEATDDAILDAEVAGSVIGVLEDGRPAPSIRWTRLLDPEGRPCLGKAEGLAVDATGRGAWVLTDPDSRRRNAELWRVALDGLSGS